MKRCLSICASSQPHLSSVCTLCCFQSRVKEHYTGWFNSVWSTEKTNRFTSELTHGLHTFVGSFLSLPFKLVEVSSPNDASHFQLKNMLSYNKEIGQLKHLSV